MPPGQLVLLIITISFCPGGCLHLARRSSSLTTCIIRHFAGSSLSRHLRHLRAKDSIANSPSAKRRPAIALPRFQFQTPKSRKPRQPPGLRQHPWCLSALCATINCRVSRRITPRYPRTLSEEHRRCRAHFLRCRNSPARGTPRCRDLLTVSCAGLHAHSTPVTILAVAMSQDTHIQDDPSSHNGTRDHRRTRIPSTKAGC